MKVKCDHRSKFSNLSNWKERAWKKKKIRASTGFEPMTSAKYRCDALPTELWSHTLGARSIYWVHIFPCSEIMWNVYEIILSPNVWLHSSVGRASHRYFAEVMSSNPVEALIFFRLLLSNCLNWRIYCDDHTSLSYISSLKIEQKLAKISFVFFWKCTSVNLAQGNVSRKLTFRSRKTIFISSVSKNGVSVQAGSFLYEGNICPESVVSKTAPAVRNPKVWDFAIFAMALRDWKVSGALEKWVPGI